MRKRVFDCVAAGLGLLLLSPLLAVLALLIWWRLGSPVLFQQSRPGLMGKPFKLIKFRSMTTAVDAAGHLLPDAQRLTGLGRFLRASSLDELPELWCVLKGEMSLVGPRPLLMEYLSLYSPEQARRHALRPGLTGWAQINGRNMLSWPQKFALWSQRSPSSAWWKASRFSQLIRSSLQRFRVQFLARPLAGGGGWRLPLALAGF